LWNKEKILLHKDFAVEFPMKNLHNVCHVEQTFEDKTQIDILVNKIFIFYQALYIL